MDNYIDALKYLQKCINDLGVIKVPWNIKSLKKKKNVNCDLKTGLKMVKRLNLVVVNVYFQNQYSYKNIQLIF